MAKGRFSVVDHTADTGLDIASDSIEGILETAAQGFICLVFGKTEAGKEEAETLQLHEDTFEDLAVELLRRMLLKIETEDVRIFDAAVSDADETHCTATIYHAPLEAEEEIKLHIKAVTYHGLELKKEGDLYRIRIIFDV